MACLHDTCRKMSGYSGLHSIEDKQAHPTGCREPDQCLRAHGSANTAEGIVWVYLLLDCNNIETQYRSPTWTRMEEARSCSTAECDDDATMDCCCSATDKPSRTCCSLPASRAAAASIATRPLPDLLHNARPLLSCSGNASKHYATELLFYLIAAPNTYSRCNNDDKGGFSRY